MGYLPRVSSREEYVYIRIGPKTTLKDISQVWRFVKISKRRWVTSEAKVGATHGLHNTVSISKGSYTGGRCRKYIAITLTGD